MSLIVLVNVEVVPDRVARIPVAAFHRGNVGGWERIQVWGDFFRGIGFGGVVEGKDFAFKKLIFIALDSILSIGKGRINPALAYR